MTDPGAALHRPMGAPHVQGYPMDVLESCSGCPPWAALIAHSGSWAGPFPKGAGWKLESETTAGNTLKPESVIRGRALGPDWTTELGRHLEPADTALQQY